MMDARDIFAAWAAMSDKTRTKRNRDRVVDGHRQPKDKNEVIRVTGPEAWLALHRYAIDVAEWNADEAAKWYRKWKRTIPREGCGCQSHWGRIVNDNPIDYSSRGAFFEWTVRRHNDVNRYLGKPEVSIEIVRNLYSPSP